MPSRIISVAPMMGWTDRHARYFLRLISKHTLLYTEMVTTGAILNGPRERLLQYHPAEHPLVLQLGGSDPGELAECSCIAEDLGFEEVNLNVGCPSDRVLSGKFGACLMAKPELVAECVHAMKSAVNLPVTVKCRTGIDDMEHYSDLSRFVTTVAESGCDTFIVHARKAWLQGLSPKQNREIPPLKYEYVHQLKKERPDLSIVINGGIRSLDEVADQLQYTDGVMLGREAYHNPYLMAQVDQRFYGDAETIKTRHEVLEQLVEYINMEISCGTRLHSITRHIHGLFLGLPGARAWRRSLSLESQSAGAGSDAVLCAARQVSIQGSSD